MVVGTVLVLDYYRINAIDCTRTATATTFEHTEERSTGTRYQHELVL